MSIKIGMVSLGCPKNLVDSELMLGGLAAKGCAVTPDASQAEILLVNTCGFIESAKKESIETILEMARYKKEGNLKKLIVTGCLVQGYVEELKRELPEVDAFLGSADFRSIGDVVDELMNEKRKKGALIKISAPVDLYDENLPRLLSTPPWTAYLKMAEGCDHACAFCAIPKLRGKMRSRTIESVVKEAQMLAKRGVKEINVISQDSSEYGRDLYGKPRLAELLEELDKVEGPRWIRVHYLYPAFLDEKLMRVMAEGKRLAKYVDLPLQHADDAMLKAMRRPGSYDANLKTLRDFRRLVPGVSLRSSFIVGYPGETEAQFKRLLEFLREASLDRAGFFTYSQEVLTPSGSLPDQLPEKVKKERQKDAMLVSLEVSAARLKNKIGQEIDVLIEGAPGASPEEKSGESVEHGPYSARGMAPRGQYVGRSQGDAPEIDGRVYVDAGKNALKPGDFVRVKIMSSTEHDLLGSLLP